MEFKYKDTCLIPENKILEEGERLKEYIKFLNKVVQENNYGYPESFINLPFDDKILDTILRTKVRINTSKLKYIFLVGIGGSSLGVKAIYEALEGHFAQNLPENTFQPRIIFIDTINPSYLYFLKNYLKENKLEPENYLTIIITKSGNTTEAVFNAEILNSLLPYTKERTIFITDKDSKLFNLAQKKKYKVLEIPTKVGGRYSVLSAVGLFPLSLVGISPGSLTIGAKEITGSCLDINISNNPSAISAISIYLNYKKGNIINDNFFFNPELESLGKWYRQLTGESLGKEQKGIFPSISIGSTDLHSMVQLYLGGPPNIFTTFIKAERNRKALTFDHEFINEESPEHTDKEWFKEHEPKTLLPMEFAGLVENIDNRTPSQVLDAIYNGVIATYKNKNKPFIEISLDEIGEENLGRYMQFKMIEMVYLGKLLEVNPFDQPNVEEYKEETRKILSSA